MPLNDVLRKGAFPSLGRYIAIDLGTANTVISEKDRGIILDEPSVVIVDNDTGNVLSVGEEARIQAGKAPNSRTVYPLQHGVISDFDVCAKMLQAFISKINVGKLVRPRMVICVPTSVTPVEKRAVIKVAQSAGANRNVYVIEEPMAAAIGAGMDISQPQGNMVVDIGGGTTEIAVISAGGIVTAKSITMAGNALDNAIVQHIKKECDFSCSPQYMERIKMLWGSVWPLKTEQKFKVRGINLRTGYPSELQLDTWILREAMAEPIQEIIDAIQETLNETPPELAADIFDLGIVLTGGGAQIHGLVQRISYETKLKVRKADTPIHSVVQGCAMSLDSYRDLPPSIFSAISE